MPLFNGDGYKAFRIGADGSNNAIEIRHTGNVDIPLTLPTGFLERDYTAIMAQVISDQGTGTSIVTSAATSPWSVTVNKPTFTRVVFYNGDASVTVNAPDDIADGEIALLKVTIVGNDGGTTVASRALKAVDPVDPGTYDAIGAGNSRRSVADSRSGATCRSCHGGKSRNRYGREILQTDDRRFALGLLRLGSHRDRRRSVQGQLQR